MGLTGLMGLAGCGSTAQPAAGEPAAAGRPVTAVLADPTVLAAELPGPARGRPLSPAQAARIDRHIGPDGRGLPPGRGSVAEGAVLYQARCAACHGVDGRGLSAEELVGGVGSLRSAEPEKNVGSYWPHAPTLFDFIRRAMPLQAPGSLTDSEVYALSAWLLHANGLLPADAVMDAASLAAVRMPNRAGFVPAGDPAQP